MKLISPLDLSTPEASHFRYLVMASLVVLAIMGCGSKEESLPKLFTLPDAELVLHTGTRTSIAELRGKVAIYDFVFTRCSGTCPIMTSKMATLADRLKDESEVQFLSISVDPEWDTAERLSEYKERYSDDPRWWFLTGNRDEIVRLSVDGFKLAAGDDAENVTEPLLHSSKFVLVDGDAVVRGYYDSFVDGDLQRLEDDTRRLLD